MNNKLVSIVIPIYNMGKKIEICTKSILNQTYKNIEVIMVDDGSTDDSFLHCKKLETQDQRITVIHTENRGSGPARNEGIACAKGDYIYFPDADDYIEPDAIQILVDAMEDTSCDLIVFGYKNIGTSGKLISIKKYENATVLAQRARDDYSDYFSANGSLTIQGAPWNKFFNLKLIKEHNILYPSLRRHQDEAFISRYVNIANSIAFISDVLYSYYVNDLNRQWDKYPVDYIEAVCGLFDERKTNVLLWNKLDNKTHELVYKEYICGVIKALELSFSPKFGFGKKQRKAWIKNVIDKSDICDISIPDGIGKYQRFMFKIILHRHFELLYQMLKLKVYIEKNNWLIVLIKK